MVITFNLYTLESTKSSCLNKLALSISSEKPIGQSDVVLRSHQS